jgi:hypothetical protein
MSQVSGKTLYGGRIYWKGFGRVPMKLDWGFGWRQEEYAEWAEKQYSTVQYRD